MPDKDISIKRYDTIIALLMYMILFTSVIAGQNLIEVFGITITTGMLIFPFTYILIAASTELYGIKKTREIIFSVAFCNIIMILTIFAFTQIPSERAFLGNSELYHDFSNRISYLLFISTIAFLISENLNAWIISRLKILTSGNMLVFRAFLSTACAIILDTWLVFPLFLSRQQDIEIAILETLVVMTVKLAYDMALLPVFWAIIAFIKYKSDEEIDALPECARPYTAAHYLSTSEEA